MPLRVLLVYSNRSLDLLPAPPIGLSYVATAASHAGHEIAFLDLFPEEHPHEALRHALHQHRPDVVGISVRNIDSVVHQRLSKHLGELNDLITLIRGESRARIVLGGPAISILGSATFSRLDADVAVLGEGEIAFPEVLATIEHNRPLGGINGICFREGEKIITNRPVLLNRFGASGMERWINWPAYERRGGTWTIQSKRGCPLHCSYCAYPAIEGLGWRRRPAGEVVDEIEHVLHEVRPRAFEFVDSTFNVPLDNALAICEEIIRRGLKVNLTAMGINPLTASDTLFSLMKRAGFNSMMITPEAANDTILRNLNKGFTMVHVHRTVQAARKSGMNSTWFFLLGGPGETRETVEETVSFVEQHLNWKNCLSIFMTGIRILPGTDIARQATEEGYLSAQSDLAEPHFYFSPHVSEELMLNRINRAVARHPNIVHAAEEGGSSFERLFQQVLYLLGVAPPYWRFLPAFLRFLPLHALRRRYPSVGGQSQGEAGVTPGCERPRGPSRHRQD